MDTVVKVIQDFGLNMIQNLGTVTHSLNILTRKIEDIEYTITYLKGLGKKLEEVNMNNDKTLGEFKYTQSLIKALRIQNNDNSKIESNSDNETKSSQSLLEEYNEMLNGLDDIEGIVSQLQSVKESIFEITGGHRILFEINKEIMSLKKIEFVDDSIKDSLHEKIQFWLNKL